MWYKFFAKVLAGITALELGSWLAFNYPQFGHGLWVLAMAVVFSLSLYRLEYGVYAVVAELVVGSHGYMLSAPLAGFTVSLRLGIFSAVFAAWLVWVWRSKNIYFFSSRLWKWYIALFTFLGVGVVVGYLNGNSLSNIFFDWNGYLFFGLILPFTQAIRERQHVIHLIVVLFAGVAILALKTSLIVFLFSHNDIFIYYLPSLYSWIRDFRIGEITLQPNGFYRVFFQSHIYVLYAGLLALPFLIQRIRWQFTAIFGTAITLVFLSYSRSFWVAALLTLAIAFGWFWWRQRVRFIRLLHVYCLAVGLCIAGYAIILGVINFPLASDAGSGVGAGSLLSERTQDPTSEAAGGSRLALLQPLLKKNIEHPFLGSGFGTTVTYRTQDPRALASNSDGLYTTFAFEWGYLDLWLKLGVAGTAVYGVMLWLLLATCFHLSKKLTSPVDQSIVVGVGLGIVALAIVHGLTPYLNHPLGIGWIVIATVLFDYYLHTEHGQTSR